MGVELRGDGITLRDLRIDDVDGLHGIYGDPLVTEHLQFSPRTRQAVEALVERTVAAASHEPRVEYMLMVSTENDADVVGTVRLGMQPYRAAELGFAVAHRAWGHGVGAAAVRLTLRYAFEDLGLHRVGAARSPRNEASAALLHKLGFLDEGVIHDHIEKDGVYRDSITSYLLEGRYRELQGDATSANRSAPAE